MQKTYADFGINLKSHRTDPGGNTYTTCPQCSSGRKKKNAPCLSVNLQKEVWKCWNCDWTGTLKAGGKQWKVDNSWNRPEWHLPDPPASSSPIPDVCYQWFDKRGIEREIVDAHGILYKSIYMPQLESFTKAIWFPYYRDKKVINYKYRTLADKHFRLAAGAERILYGLDDIAGHDTVYIVEGEIDKLSLAMVGYPNCVSVPNGAPPANAKNVDTLLACLDDKRLDAVKHFVIAVDTDEPGLRLKDELIHRLGKGRCSVITWPDGCKDANDVLVNLGMATLSECLFAARLPPIEGSIEVCDVMPDVLAMYDEELEPGALTGWAGIDELYRVRLGLWTLVTGIPGHGKSEWLDALLVNLARLHGWNIAVFSPENQPIKLHVAKLIEKVVGKPFNKKHLLAMEKHQAEQAGNWLNNHFTFIACDENKYTLDFIFETTANLVKRKGLRGLVIDPWNELEHQRSTSLSETEYISKTLGQLRQFARKHNIHIWLVAHPTKMQRVIKKFKNPRTGNNKEYTVYPVPTPYDVSGAAHFRNKADNAVTIYRMAHPDFDGHPVQVHVQKIRFKPDGKIGKALLFYDVNTGIYKDVPADYQENIQVAE
jgi:twinkle protein